MQANIQAKSSSFDIPYYSDYIPQHLAQILLQDAKPVKINRKGNLQILFSKNSNPEFDKFETIPALEFVVDLYQAVKEDLSSILAQRQIDRQFIDQWTSSCVYQNKTLAYPFRSPQYKTVIGLRDRENRIVIGHLENSSTKQPIAPIPDFLSGQHITLFGPPDNAKMALNAMNCFHRKLPNEPPIIEEILSTSSITPKWGADDEDSKTPMREDLLQAGVNLNQCFNKTLTFHDEQKGKTLSLETEKLAQPIKRIPGLALPNSFVWWNKNPIPLHIYDFALQIFHAWKNPEALVFYIPKLETEDEALYIAKLFSTAEKMIKSANPSYVLGSCRIFVVLENPRAVFRVDEIMDNLYPYFCGASLGWHDYLASTARLFKNDYNYRIPVKADPDIVIKHIKESHTLLSSVVGARGGIKIGGMYGILPLSRNLDDPSMQVTLIGYIRDVVTQMKRGLEGFWVAHPDFIRIGIALVEAWNTFKSSKNALLLNKVISDLIIDPKQVEKLISFTYGPDIQGFSFNHPLYPRALLAADIEESDVIANNHPEEIRYNVFQVLQYLADWLSGRGCVALPAVVGGHSVRIMDDLATTERSRWELWHEIHHGRFPLDDFLRIVNEEFNFIRRGRATQTKKVAIPYNKSSEKWYQVAKKLILHFVLSPKPAEFVTEFLLPFTVEKFRAASDPYQYLMKILNIDNVNLLETVPSTQIASGLEKWKLDKRVVRFMLFFDCCGCQRFASRMSTTLFNDSELVEKIIFSFSESEIKQSASFHGEIGEPKQSTLDHLGQDEQEAVLKSSLKSTLYSLGQEYKQRFGFKFMIRAKSKDPQFLLDQLKIRMQNTRALELINAKKALAEIAILRMKDLDPTRCFFRNQAISILKANRVPGMAISIINNLTISQNYNFGLANVDQKQPVTDDTHFQVASLSKSIAAAFSINYLRKRRLSIDTAVNKIFLQFRSEWLLKSAPGVNQDWANKVTVRHLLNHTALGMHYVHGIPNSFPSVLDLINGRTEFKYPQVFCQKAPGQLFSYSGAGYLVLQYLLECVSQRPIEVLMRPWLNRLGLHDFTFAHPSLKTLGGSYTSIVRESPGLFTTPKSAQFAAGYLTDDPASPQVPLLHFPPLAAGGWGSSNSIARFLIQLLEAHGRNPKADPDTETNFRITQQEARELLHGSDRGSQLFMKADMGLGFFICEAGPNRIAIHQAANDGFRGLYAACFRGPDKGAGFVILANGDNSAMKSIANISQLLLTAFQWQGINYEYFSQNRLDDHSLFSKMKQEEIVNQGFKKFIFDAFIKDLPENPENPNPQIDPWAENNHAINSKLVWVTNEQFARVTNMISPYVPVLNPSEFGQHGKVMDSWETRRHNPSSVDIAEFKLNSQQSIQYIQISTEYHDGNHMGGVRIDAYCTNCNQWTQIVAKTGINGHSLHRFTLKNPVSMTSFRIIGFPDGGLTRVGLFTSVPTGKHRFWDTFPSIPTDGSNFAFAWKKFPHPIPAVIKEKTSFNYPRQDQIDLDWSLIPVGSIIDVASASYGGKVEFTTNQHYGPASAILSPYPPHGMFDGFESARSRANGHFDYVVIKLGKRSMIYAIEFDFQFFKHNNPRYVTVIGHSGQQWIPIITQFHCKPFAGGQLFVKLHPDVRNKMIDRLTIISDPDGGYNRLHVYTFVTKKHKQVEQTTTVEDTISAISNLLQQNG